ncbi:MAG: VCBS repeat-containing protein, partial [Microbacteriaceae bacterium]|nr:VCBS repeat-containing protein [Microbacteriaceae bacterium]
DSILAVDFDVDGYDDMAIRTIDSRVRIIFGGPDGLAWDHPFDIPAEVTGVRNIATGVDFAATGSAASDISRDSVANATELPDDRSIQAGTFIYEVPRRPAFTSVPFGGRPHLFATDGHEVRLITVGRGHANVAVQLTAADVVGVDVGPLRDDYSDDLVLVSRSTSGASLGRVHFRQADGRYHNSPDVEFDLVSANGVLVAKLDGPDSPTSIIVSQDMSSTSYSIDSLMLELREGRVVTTARFATHCALEVALVALWGDHRLRPVFANHEANSVLGHVDSMIYVPREGVYSPESVIRLEGRSATGIRLVDLHDRGAADILLVNTGENDSEAGHPSYVYSRDHDGQWHLSETIGTHEAMSVAIADFRRCGYLDLIFSRPQCGHLEYFQGGPDGFSGPTAIDLPHATGDRQARFISHGDLNGDGYLDLVIPDLSAEGGVIIMWGGPDGFHADRSQLLRAGRVLSSRVADLTGDGHLDLVVGGFKGDDPGDPYRTQVYIYWGSASGYSNDRRQELPGQFVHDICVADFDNDGLLDIFVANYHGLRTRDVDSWLYWNSPAGFSAERRTAFPAGSAAGALAADLDGNGWRDLVIAHHKDGGNHTTHSAIWWNDATGFDVRRRTLLPTLGPHGMTQSDIGNIADRSDEETFISRPHPMASSSGELAMVLTWDADIPAGTWLRADIRIASSEADLRDAPWIPMDGGSEGATAQIEALSEASYTQYRLHLGSRQSIATPRVRRVSVRTQTTRSDGR